MVNDKKCVSERFFLIFLSANLVGKVLNCNIPICSPKTYLHNVVWIYKTSIAIQKALEFIPSFSKVFLKLKNNFWQSYLIKTYWKEVMYSWLEWLLSSPKLVKHIWKMLFYYLKDHRVQQQLEDKNLIFVLTGTRQ